MVNMQFTMVDVSDVNIEVGDFVELIKSPLYIKEKRRTPTYFGG